MIALTSCEKIVYVTLLEENAPIDRKEVIRIVNCKNNKNWSKRAVKCFLDRLVKVGCVERRRYKMKWYYKAVKREITDRKELVHPDEAGGIRF